jgi:glycerol-3-phosphate cytidylyltransferase-like family protein
LTGLSNQFIISNNAKAETFNKTFIKAKKMATDKLFTVAGTSKFKGETKLRFANDSMRVKVLDKHGHEDIVLIELPEAMTKMSAARFIKTLNEFQSVVSQAAIDDYLDREQDQVRTPRTPKVSKTPVKSQETQRDLSDLEDAPF